MLGCIIVGEKRVSCCLLLSLDQLLWRLSLLSLLLCIARRLNLLYIVHLEILLGLVLGNVQARIDYLRYRLDLSS